MASDLRVVIPTLDEADTLGGLLADLQAQTGCELDIVVADGGSRDATRSIARRGGARVVTTAAGRARQMNAGAAGFAGPWLLFLHADSRLECNHQLQAALAVMRARPETTAGHFPLTFMDESGPAPGFLFRYMAAKTRTGRRYTINGDQGCLIRTAFFNALGGYDTRHGFLEDQRLDARVEAAGRWQRLPYRLMTSARRFEAEGRYRRYGLMALIMTMYVADLSDFFDTAPTVYVPQSKTRGLTVSPYLAHALDVFGAAPARTRWRALWRVADVAAGQAWQLHLAVALALGALAGERSDDAIADRFACAGRALSSSLPAGLLHNTARMVLFFALAVAVFGPLACLRWWPPGRASGRSKGIQ